MKKTLLLLLGLLTGTTLLTAAPVTLEQAQQRAQQFIVQQLGRHSSSQSLHLAQQQPRLEQAQADEACYYVFNVGTNQGFVIVSGDDRTTEILGYATDGTFNTNDMPDNMRAWLQGYQDQMKWMDEHNYQPVAKLPAKPAIAYLLTTTWNQGAPYNNFCPLFLNTTERCVTGCVATAMAQVLAYYGLSEGKPASTTQTIPGYSCSTNWSGYGQMYVSAKSVTTFDWSNMLTNYAASTDNNPQNNAVARLMEYCGASIQMNYGIARNSGSSAYNSDVAPALHNYFNFDGEFTVRDSYSYEQWDNLIYTELAASRPVLFSGQSSGGGHAFVIDGYNGDGLYHVNWGWGSHCDGYFVLSILNSNDNSGIGASSSDDGYSFGQNAVIGIKPATGPSAETPLSMSLYGSLSITGTTIKFGAFNWTGAENTFDIAVAITDVDGNIQKVKPITTSYTFGPNNGSFSFQSTISDSDMTGAGTYHVVPVSKLSTATEWVVMTQPKEYVEAVFDGTGNVSLTLFPQDYSLSTTPMIVKGTKYAGQKQNVNVTVVNEGSGEFYGVLYLFASQTATKGEYQNHGGATILGGESMDMQFNFTPSVAGTWNLWVATDEEGNNVIGTGTVEIENDPYTPEGNFMVTTLTIQDADGDWQVQSDGTRTIDVLNTTGDIILSPTFKNLTSTNYNIGTGSIHFELQSWNGSEWKSMSYYSNSSELTINAGSQVQFGDMPFSSMPYGKYRFVLSVGGSVTDTHYVFYTAKEKIPTWAADGTPIRQLVTSNSIVVDADATVADLSRLADLSSYTITPNSNPNCLYLLANGATTPSVLEGKNVVVGSEAEQITLVDNGTNGFFSPIAFTTQNISYTRTFTKGYASDGSGWTTITLPFNVAKVTTGMQELDWCHNSSDEGKNFYLMEFTSDAMSTVNFSHAETFKANTPYIIAVAGSEFGTAWDLTNKSITFSATATTVPASTTILTSGTNYRFFGNMNSMDATKMYKLNNDGTKFQLTSSDEVEPFRAYFVDNGGGATSLGIGIDGLATGIADITVRPTAPQQQGVYNLSGVRVADSLQQLPAGIYIVNGKKVIK